jgi:hypothetical protein
MVQTLFNFGVPVGDGKRGGIIQPKVKYKFRVRAFGFGGDTGAAVDLTRQVQSIGRPQVQSQSVQVHSYNSIGYYAGKPEWQSITMSVRDDISNSVSRLVGHQEQKQMNHIAQTTARAGINYKFDLEIETLDGGNGSPVEVWSLEGCFLESIQYDSFDYTSSEPMMIEMNIRYDNAILDTMPRQPLFSGYGDALTGGSQGAAE